MTYHPIHRRWRSRRLLWWMLPLELFGVVACLAMFGIAQPDTYRTTMWEIGGKEGFNSAPNYQVYFAANYKPIPTTPFVWSQTLTDFNVAISIISLFTLIGKLILIIMRLWFPIASIALHTCLATLYIVSIYGQMGPDHMDPRYPSNIAWYIRMGCDVAEKYGDAKSCKMAKGSFAAAIYMIFVLLVMLGQAVWSMLPNPDNDIKMADDDDDDDESSSDNGREKGWEMTGFRSPMSPGGRSMMSGRSVPFTPRTQAFHTLESKLPLRS
ncbi:hypothetical protein MKZ38_007867 [Zalerion maritima]|uniref:Uncharacterized protein n=1 Tax=Zalerion maritima TaxID=339359 RepID=A0AAD5WU33_9PEZI|nr:hypothetical protein MKZ38_007867 [Zalerion maritima]